jgi:hypothetical protein
VYQLHVDRVCFVCFDVFTLLMFVCCSCRVVDDDILVTFDDGRSALKALHLNGKQVCWLDIKHEEVSHLLNRWFLPGRCLVFN